jgi:hypothetical protein
MPIVPIWKPVLLLVFGLLIVISYWLDPAVAESKEAGVVMKLPIHVGSFLGEATPISRVELDILPKDTEFARKNYEDFRGHSIICTIVLSGAMQQSIHRPEVCLDAQGWSIIKQDDWPIRLASGRDLVVRNLTLRREDPTPDGRRQVTESSYMYWFVGDNVTTPSHYTRMFLSNWDRIVHNRTHRWAYVIATAQITGGDASQTCQMLSDFIRQAVPAFQKSEMPDGGKDGL